LVSSISGLAAAFSGGEIDLSAFADMVTEDVLLTTSGYLLSQIPSLAGYATQVWVNSNIDTVSGVVVSQIPSLSGYATQVWISNQDLANHSDLSTLSGVIVSQIPSLDSYATQAWTTNTFVTLEDLSTFSGGGGVTLQQLLTTSGVLVAQIPSLTGYATQTWVDTNFIDNNEITAYVTQTMLNTNYYTKTDINTISGVLANQTPSSSTGFTWNFITSDTSAETNNGYIIDAGDNSVNLSLPVLPEAGDSVGIKVVDLTNEVLVSKNGSPIFGQISDLTIDILGAAFTLVYTNSSYGWVCVDQVYESMVSSFSNEYSMYFDGSNDYVSAPDSDALDFGTDGFSISVWFKAAEDGLNIIQSMVSKIWDVSSSTGTPGWCIGLNSSGRVEVYLGDTGDSNNEPLTGYEMSLVDYRDNMWHNVISIIDRSLNTLYIYFDGELKNSFDISEWTTSFDSSYPLYLGANYNKGGALDGYYKGYLDEVSIFNSVLSLDDVSRVYNDGLGSDLSGFDNLVAWYRMGD